MKRILLVNLILMNLSLYAQEYQLALWPEKVPNQLTTKLQEQQEVRDLIWVTDVSAPEIEIFLPTKRHVTGQAILICPGGGYGGLAYDWEGRDIAKWLNSKGIAGIVLKYRLPSPELQPTPRLAPLQDAKQAIRMIRHHAPDWGIDPKKVGVMGFSAGGHLASTLGTHFNDSDSDVENQLQSLSARPDFMILVYPVISMMDDITHKGSRTNLLGENPTSGLIQAYSNELRVNRETPPTFLVHSADDEAVPVANSLRIYQALLKNKIPVEMHLYPTGGHGYSLALDDGHLSNWPDLLSEWLGSL